MPFLLVGIGVFALIAGLAMVGFGIPINEFSFGNTLISAGTTAIMGGLIIIALGATVGQLRRIAQALASQSPMAVAQHDQHEPPEPAAMNAPGQQGRSSFRARPDPRSEMRPEMPPVPNPLNAAPSVLSGENRHEIAPAPMLRNPDDAALTVEDEISLSPPHPLNAGPQPAPDLVARQRATGPGPFGAPAQNQDGRPTEASPPWRSPPPLAAASGGNTPPRPQQAARFDAMWPAEAKPAAKPLLAPEAKPDLASTLGGALKRNEPDAQKPRAVAVLKSGVVDGMGYTLYVDGSIEAELPQGTLRFASINELRSHLEKNS